MTSLHSLGNAPGSRLSSHRLELDRSSTDEDQTGELTTSRLRVAVSPAVDLRDVDADLARHLGQNHPRCAQILTNGHEIRFSGFAKQCQGTPREHSTSFRKYEGLL